MSLIQKSSILIFQSLLLLCCSLLFFNSVAAKQRTPGTQRPYIINNRTYYPLPSADGYVESGIASWYGRDFHGRPTSNGETYDMHNITAAHKLLPMHTMLLVQNQENGKKVVVRVNDRSPEFRLLPVQVLRFQEVAQQQYCFLR